MGEAKTNLNDVVKDNSMVEFYLDSFHKEDALICFKVGEEIFYGLYPRKDLEDAGITEEMLFTGETYKEGNDVKIRFTPKPMPEDEPVSDLAETSLTIDEKLRLLYGDRSGVDQ